jgi:hypothetical protein
VDVLVPGVQSAAGGSGPPTLDPHEHQADRGGHEGAELDKGLLQAHGAVLPLGRLPLGVDALAKSDAPHLLKCESCHNHSVDLKRESRGGATDRGGLTTVSSVQSMPSRSERACSSSCVRMVGRQLTCYGGAMEGLQRCYGGAIETLWRRHRGAMEAP